MVVDPAFSGKPQGELEMANKDRPGKNLAKKKDSDVANKRAEKKAKRREEKKALRTLKRKSKRSGYIPTQSTS